MFGSEFDAPFQTVHVHHHSDERTRELMRQLDAALERERALRDALSHVLWVKDCGIDAIDEHGVFRNHPDEERDQMYEIAKAALAAKGEK